MRDLSMAHDHDQDLSGGRLLWAVIINVLLTVVQLVAGVVSGSLALVADALHNFSDAGSLVVAYFAKKISGKPATQAMTFGYGRAEILGALINSVTLVVVAVYLAYESIGRFNDPKPIEGWIVIAVAGVALVIDVVTAWLTHAGAKKSVNFRAAFVHNVSDALASVVVMVSGALILLYQVYWVDLAATLIISAYVMWHSSSLLKTCIRILMEAAPEELEVEEIKKSLLSHSKVVDVHHLHVWQIHERFRSFEAHLVIDSKHLDAMETIKKDVKEILKNRYQISHSTLEFETLFSDSEIVDHEGE